jgi:dihydrofolate reductase
MRKIIVGAQVSLDGVMQAPGGPWEDPTKGFKFGGWVMPYFDQVFGEEIDRVFKEKCALLLGRKTYEIFAGYWPYYDETDPHGGIAKLFKDIKKYVVSRSGDVDTCLLIGHYERAGDIKIGDTALDSPSDAERARRARMKREG